MSRLRGSVLLARPMPGVRPGGRPTFLCEQESRQRNRPCKTAHPQAAGYPALLGHRGRDELAPLCPARTSVASQCLKRAKARASMPCDARRFRRGDPEQPTAELQTHQPARAGCSFTPPLSPAEERKELEAACASTLQALTPRNCSTTAALAPRREFCAGPQVLRTAGNPSQREGRAVRGRLFAYFLVAQKVGRPPGRLPGMDLAAQSNSSKRLS